MSESGNLPDPATASGSEAAPPRLTPRRVAETRQEEDQKLHRAEDMKKWTDMEAKMEADAIAHAHDEDVSGMKAELERL
ncbi:hypothetical protein LTR35_005719 [Friedmanniomyces endolithicus]|nr:hypothetical protein LTR35_005719 [Friedmanniomyces endolithicus]KAK0297747.1 hypothetical protein LTS00_003880 [Friedmanniomyces endolithicus]KAK1009152.1 hypothetical protein LTR54_005953 [Friedmanniomyces endolithicus]